MKNEHPLFSHRVTYQLCAWREGPMLLFMCLEKGAGIYVLLSARQLHLAILVRKKENQYKYLSTE